MIVSPPHRAGVGPVEAGDLALVQVCLADFVNAEQFHLSWFQKVWDHLNRRDGVRRDKVVDEDWWHHIAPVTHLHLEVGEAN